MLEQVIEFVDQSFSKSAIGSENSHFQRTLYWAKELRPDSDEAIQIAAYSHDIQRAFRPTNTPDTFRDREMNDPDFLRFHQEEGAKIIKKFLRERGYDEVNIQRVYNMVCHHEEGGDEESDLIKDCDSLSYFDTVVNKHIQKMGSLIGKEKIRRKIEWMFNRISSSVAKEIARPKYQEALRLLDA